MKRFVIGVDGSAASRSALRWTVSLARPMGASVVVVHAFDARLEPRFASLDQLREDRIELLRRWSDGIVDDVPHQLEVVHGDPRAHLLDQTFRGDADLLVVAATGASKATPGVLHLGSVTESLAHRVEVPLAVVRGDPGRPTRRPLVAVDGSVHSRAAVGWLADAVAALVVSVAAVTVGEPPALSRPDGRWAETARERIVSDWASPIVDRDIDLVPIARRNLNVADGILRTVAERGCDLVVLGMRGTSVLTGARIGGTAFNILHRATVPIVLIPPAPTPA